VNQIEVHPYFEQTALQRLQAEHATLTQAWSRIGGVTSCFAGARSSDAVQAAPIPAAASAWGRGVRRVPPEST
jgi:diketogulonate reductase-like aldo/keto reductase